MSKFFSAVLFFGLPAALYAVPWPPSPLLLQELGLEITPEHVWKYHRPHKSQPAVLNPEHREKVRGFLSRLPERNPEPALAEPLIGALKEAGMPPEQTLWFEQKNGALFLTPKGKAMVIGAVLGDPWGTELWKEESGTSDWMSRLPLSLSFEEPEGVPDKALQLQNRLEGAESGEALWHPLGPLPADEAAAGRAYQMPASGAQVLKKGEWAWKVHFNASNYIHQEDHPGSLWVQRYETETLGLGSRYGFELGRIPMEVESRLDFHRDGRGVMDPFIEWVERTAAWAVNNPDVKNDERFGSEALKHGFLVEKDGRTVVNRRGSEYGLGDIYAAVKMGLTGRDSASATHLAARLAVNLSTDRDFDGGDYAGLGLSLEQRLASWLALHADLHALRPFHREDDLGFSLKSAAIGGMTGLEAALWRNTSIGLQFHFHEGPYRDTGFDALDRASGVLVLGLSHRFNPGTIFRIYCGENVEFWPFGKGSDPDFSFGLSLESKF